jgi:hypothetical protein
MRITSKYADWYGLSDAIECDWRNAASVPFLRAAKVRAPPANAVNRPREAAQRLRTEVLESDAACAYTATLFRWSGIVNMQPHPNVTQITLFSPRVTTLTRTTPCNGTGVFPHSDRTPDRESAIVTRGQCADASRLEFWAVKAISQPLRPRFPEGFCTHAGNLVVLFGHS